MSPWNMAPLDDRPQIGTISVDPGSLDQHGVELLEMLTELGLTLPRELPADTPLQGWRVLSTQYGGITVLGAPVDGDRQRWQIGQAQRGYTDPAKRTFSVHPMAQQRRPSSRERAGGLILRWPETTRSAPTIDLLAVDIVNTGAERWHPQGDSFMVFANIRRRNGSKPDMYYGYVGGQNPALPLDPGEYVRTRVVIESFGWDQAEPGAYEVDAVLIDLGVSTSDPILIELTAQEIRDHAPRRPMPPPPPVPS
jgi:hypothetical protein